MGLEVLELARWEDDGGPPYAKEEPMACPTCNQTMQCVYHEGSRRNFWCPNCGTLREFTGDFVRDEVPRIVTKWWDEEARKQFEQSLQAG